MIEVRDLVKIYRVRKFFKVRDIIGLNGISFEIGRAGIYGIVGPNGAGKTTLFKILLGLVLPTSGIAKIFGISSYDPETKKRIGYVPEDITYPKFLTARKFLELTGDLFGMDKSFVKRRISELISTVELSDWLDIRIEKFSKGMLQRLSLARALMHEPDILLLDESLNGVDPGGRIFFKDYFRQLKDEGKIILLSTHILSDAEELCDEVFLIDSGRIIAHIHIPDLSKFQVVEFHIYQSLNLSSQASFQSLQIETG